MADFRTVSLSVWCYRGDVATPKWYDVDTGESSYSFLISN